ncbi:MAG: hypothetical protein LBM39_00235 [Candidatus Methanoplasma sp.]|jgi:hypothetical protein|nr:hypothetical protein [Candidatus Methanoplasma sp.]
MSKVALSLYVFLVGALGFIIGYVNGFGIVVALYIIIATFTGIVIGVRYSKKHGVSKTY